MNNERDSKGSVLVARDRNLKETKPEDEPALTRSPRHTHVHANGSASRYAWRVATLGNERDEGQRMHAVAMMGSVPST